MFIRLNQHDFFKLFDVDLHKSQNINYDIRNIFSFNRKQSLLNKFKFNIVRFKSYTRIKVFVREEEN